jgi:hypothetical protein
MTRTMHSFYCQTMTPDEDTGLCTDLWGIIDTTGEDIGSMIVAHAKLGLRVVHVMPVPYIALDEELPV